MSFGIKSIFKFLLNTDGYNRLKLLLVSLSFFLIIGAYTVTRTLKDSFFVNIVGKEYLPLAKTISILILIPSILIFSKLVDMVRRHQLLYIYSLLYSIGGLTIAYFLSHPTIGLANTETSKYRFFGWIIYLFMEGYNPFLISLFWSFNHSITNPEESKTNYPVMVAASKLGGMITTTLACWFLTRTNAEGAQALSDVTNHQILLTGSSLMLLFVPALIYYFIRKVPGRYLHGYEAAYSFEKKQVIEHKKDESKGKTGVFSGLTLLLQSPYILGIFGTIFFWEVINSFVNIERIGVAKTAASSLSQQTSYLLNQDFWVHTIGIVITLLGTRTLIELLGERKSLALVPLCTGALLIYYFSAHSAAAMSLVYILIRAVNYAFASPLRESLYIPTTKEVKFKSKSWIDTFGVKVAKACGTNYIIVLSSIPEMLQSGFNIGFFSITILLWFITAQLLGRRFEVAVKNNEVIGAEIAS